MAQPDVPFGRANRFVVVDLVAVVVFVVVFEWVVDAFQKQIVLRCRNDLLHQPVIFDGYAAKVFGLLENLYIVEDVDVAAVFQFSFDVFDFLVYCGRFGIEIRIGVE